MYTQTFVNHSNMLILVFSISLIKCIFSIYLKSKSYKYLYRLNLILPCLMKVSLYLLTDPKLLNGTSYNYKYL